MRVFSFYGHGGESREIESIIRQRKRRIAKQQIVYTAILLAILALICLWAYNKTVYAEFDGYVSLDQNIFRTEEDIYFLEANVQVGDLAEPGDTLFSYAIASNFFTHAHNDYEPAIVSRNRDMQVQYGLARQDLDVLRVRISELERQLKTQDHNIRFGLSSNRDKMRIEQELAEAREQYKALRGKISVLLHALGDTGKSVARLQNNGYGYLNISDMYNFDLMKKLGIACYAVAVDSCIVTNKHISSHSLVLRGEPIMTLQSLDAVNNNLNVVAYVMADQMKYINHYSKGEIIVNDEVKYTGTVMMMGARTEEIPGEIRNTLSRDHTASIVVFDIDPGQNIPYWSLSDKVPVKIRIHKFRDREPQIGDYIIYNTSSGVIPESLVGLESRMEQQNQRYAARHSRRNSGIGSNKKRNRNSAEEVNSSNSQDNITPSDNLASSPQNNAKSRRNSSRPALAPSEGDYHLIVAASSNRKLADRKVKALRAIGYSNTKVVRIGESFNVAINSYPSQTEAMAAKNKLSGHKEFPNTKVVYHKQS